MIILILLVLLLPVEAYAQNVTYNFKLTWQNNEPKQTGFQYLSRRQGNRQGGPRRGRLTQIR